MIKYLICLFIVCTFFIMFSGRLLNESYASEANALKTIPTTLPCEDSESKKATPNSNLKIRNEYAEGLIGDRPIIEVSGEYEEFAYPYHGTIPYTLRIGEDPNCVAAFRLDESGEAFPIQSHYDIKNNQVVFKLNEPETVAVGYHETFSLNSPKEWYTNAVNYLGIRGILETVYKEAEINEKLSRGDFAVMVCKAFEIQENLEQGYADGGEYAKYLTALKKLGVVQGREGNLFKPNAAITKQEVMSILYNVLEVKDYILHIKKEERPFFKDRRDVHDYAEKAVEYFTSQGIVSGSQFQILPTKHTTKAEAAQLLYGLLLSVNGEAVARYIERDANINSKTTSLQVRNILQNPELPNGCEITALATVLNYLGYPIDKVNLSDKYLLQSEFYYKKSVKFGGNPWNFYIGNPKDKTGFYCYPNPIVVAANKYLASQGDDASYQAYDYSGITLEEMENCILQGIPIIVWITLDMKSPKISTKPIWINTETGKAEKAVLNLHVSVVKGFDEQYILIADPLKSKEVRISKEKFDKVFRELGSCAVILR